MLLFTGRNSICTQKVLITLFEKGLSWDTKRVDLFKNEQYDPAYLKYNPKGVVPTLVHNDKPIIESTLICEYLDETFPSPSLVPPSPYDRAQMRLWSKQIDEGIFEATREISFSAMFREKLRNMSDERGRPRVQAWWARTKELSSYKKAIPEMLMRKMSLR
jgi:ganglioside-induced differentiation-associated protein 1